MCVNIMEIIIQSTHQKIPDWKRLYLSSIMTFKFNFHRDSCSSLKYFLFTWKFPCEIKNSYYNSWDCILIATSTHVVWDSIIRNNKVRYSTKWDHSTSSHHNSHPGYIIFYFHSMTLPEEVFKSVLWHGIHAFWITINSICGLCMYGAGVWPWSLYVGSVIGCEEVILQIPWPKPFGI